MDDLNKFTSLVIQHNLRFYNFNPEELGWIISKSKISGKGIIATKNFFSGDVIFKDCPMVVGPRSSANMEPICIACYKSRTLRPCSRGCFLPVCSTCCENSEVHKFECLYFSTINRSKNNNCAGWSSELIRTVTPVRCLQFDALLKEIVHYLHKISGPNQGFEVSLLKEIMDIDLSNEDEMFMQLCCRILDANAHEIPLSKCNDINGISLRGLFPVASTMNHACCPNTTRIFDEDYRMIVKASNEILPGQEITSSYSPLLLGTPARRVFLAQSKNFKCCCSRCKDPTEFGTFLSALKCTVKTCNGVLLSISPLEFHSSWKCETCSVTLSSNKVAVIQRAITQELSRLNLKCPTNIMLFIQNNKLAADSNHTIIQFKYVLIKLLGHANGYEWPNLDNSLISCKKKICEELVTIIDKLNLGQCEIRDVCQRELDLAKNEMNHRKFK